MATTLLFAESSAARNLVSHLVVVHALRADSRPTTVQNVLAYARYLRPSQITYINAFGLIPEIKAADAIIFTYDFLWLRTWPIWKTLTNRLRSISRATPIRIAMPQDDYVHSRRLDEFVCDFRITHVYTPITADLRILYPRARDEAVVFQEALTGYVDEVELARVSAFALPYEKRDIDIGQRIRLLPTQLGPEASRKGQLALRFASAAQDYGFRCDVSVKDNDVLLGDDWYRFLGNIRFTVGAKGGATLADVDGRLWDQARRQRLRNPTLADGTIQKSPRIRNGKAGNFTAISPRMFESAALNVCQILNKDTYFPGFKPWVHYLPIDFESNNYQSVFAAMRDKSRVKEVIGMAREFLIERGNYSYSRFLAKLSRDIGLQTSFARTSITDTSEILDRVTGENAMNLQDVQEFLAQAIRRGLLKDVARELTSGTFGAVHKLKNTRSQVWLSDKESLLAWVDGLRSKRLLLESVVVPWRSATSFLSQK